MNKRYGGVKDSGWSRFIGFVLKNPRRYARTSEECADKIDGFGDDAQFDNIGDLPDLPTYRKRKR